MKIRLVGAEFQADGQTNITKLIVVFCNFANAPKKKTGSINNRIQVSQCWKILKWGALMVYGTTDDNLF
jgi:hypothetical protein